MAQASGRGVRRPRRAAGPVLHGEWDGLSSAPAVVLPFDVSISWSMLVVAVVRIGTLAFEFRAASRQQAAVERKGLLPTFD